MCVMTYRRVGSQRNARESGSAVVRFSFTDSRVDINDNQINRYTFYLTMASSIIFRRPDVSTLRALNVFRSKRDFSALLATEDEFPG
jgi:hypothetical protein